MLTVTVNSITAQLIEQGKIGQGAKGNGHLDGRQISQRLVDRRDQCQPRRIEGGGVRLHGQRCCTVILHGVHPRITLRVGGKLSLDRRIDGPAHGGAGLILGQFVEDRFKALLDTPIQHEQDRKKGKKYGQPAPHTVRGAVFGSSMSAHGQSSPPAHGMPNKNALPKQSAETGCI